MDLHIDSLDHHFTLPQTRKVAFGRPFAWIRLGWQEFTAHPAPSLAWGLVVAVAGWISLLLAYNYPLFFTTCVTGFLLLSPIVAAGIYELTSAREQGKPVSFLQSVRDYMRNLSQIAFFGVILGMIAIGWERVSAIMFALFYGGEVGTLHDFLRSLAGEYLGFSIAWVLTGAVLALVVFAVTAVSIPMLADREVDAVTAMMTSLRAVAENIAPMLLWAALIVALTAVGFATGLLGLIVIFPVLGHATWIAYKELVA
ncbi:hypothetical protein GCM10007860_28140 [Chitiniphilus shinanonensis]|uniref:Integral membrane protein n=1 Tax=Chitiniphilus shinanonensis TaxID=553088 RepID=A0ABQ6BW90_9NEIS|nr:DUF2189 domain-containing protein [Chitiniphilus shinanonensis]GLS05657.1 hypothetical protein GCM10007860_28140 [Chitiniphilus shinanonensis]